MPDKIKPSKFLISTSLFSYNESSKPLLLYTKFVLHLVLYIHGLVLSLEILLSLLQLLININTEYLQSKRREKSHHLKGLQCYILLAFMKILEALLSSLLFVQSITQSIFVK